MKTIGQLTNRSGFLVQMTRQEHEMLDKLRAVMEGIAVIWSPNVNPGFPLLEGDYADTFRAIIAFMRAQLCVNELRSAADELESMIQGKQE